MSDPFVTGHPDPGAAAETRARMWLAGVTEGPARPALFVDGPPAPDDYVDDAEARDRQQAHDQGHANVWGWAV